MPKNITSKFSAKKFELKIIDAKRWQRFMWSLFCPSELKNSMTLFGIDEIVQDYKKKVL
jgi:hypothetical protein